ncbi:YDG/SRA domain-containing protein [Gordonia rubripertincta]|nr:YDG/SRA domain-containing protein [Gordonia rubripertincta]
MFGEVPGVPEGTTFATRREAWAAGVHRETQGGMSGDATGTESIVVSGGYVDDEDHGDVIVYTGQGGRDGNTGRQFADQELTSRNLGLARCSTEGIPVRVIRGSSGDRKYSPKSGYRYDGLYQVTDYWHEVGRHGYKVWRYRLVKVGASVTSEVEDDAGTRRVETTTQRIVRNTAIAAQVKELHDHTCQVCGTRLVVATGGYSEAAHIRGLGAPHNGPDVASSILCLCPNDHVLFDNGAIYIDDEWVVRVVGTAAEISTLRRVHGHAIDCAHVQYHRLRYAAG